MIALFTFAIGLEIGSQLATPIPQVRYLIGQAGHSLKTLRTAAAIPLVIASIVQLVAS